MARVLIYSMEWCPYCAKAKALLNAKSIEYDDIDVSHDDQAAREMVERTGQRGTPQLFIDDEWIGGYDSLAYLNATGELDTRLGLEVTVDLEKVWDVAVVGGGPAGITAAMYAARKSLSTIIVTHDLGGQVGVTHTITNYPGLPVITGPDLIKLMFEQAYTYSIERLIGENVTALDIEGRARVLRLESGKTVKARTVIVATGAQKRKLDIPGEKEFGGHGVVYCSTCDGPFYRDATIAIVGGGNSAMEAALEMEAIAKKIHLVSTSEWSGERFLADRVRVAKKVKPWIGYQPVEIKGDDVVRELVIGELRGGKTRTLKVDGVFIEIGWFPNSDFMLDLVDTNQSGEIVVDGHGVTGARGVFAAGDVTDGKDKQIVVAAGEGAKAALAAFDYLIHQK